MWDKPRQSRQYSRKRAMRAARARAGERIGGPGQAAARARETRPEETQVPTDPGRAPEDPEALSEPAAPPEPAAPDPTGSLAWTGLTLLALLLGGFILAIMFMMG